MKKEKRKGRRQGIEKEVMAKEWKADINKVKRQNLGRNKESEKGNEKCKKERDE
jgi:hypothetical protein